MFLLWYWFAIFSSIHPKLVYALAWKKIVTHFLVILKWFGQFLDQNLEILVGNPGKSRIFRFASVTFWFVTFSKINIFFDDF